MKEQKQEKKYCEKCKGNIFNPEKIYMAGTRFCHCQQEENEPQEKSVVEENRIYAILGDCKRGAITIELAVYNIKDILSNLQKETDDKWKARIEELETILARLKLEFDVCQCDCGKLFKGTDAEKVLDQATSIIKELVK